MHPRRPRIVFLNRCYWPDSEATGQLLTDLCQHLADDFEVHVVCGQPNSPLKGSAYLEKGVEVRERVTMHRLSHTRFPKSSRIGRALNLVTFYLSAWWYLLRNNLHADVVVSETDPFMLPHLGASFAKRSGAKHVCYLQDIYPDVAEAIDKVPRGLRWTPLIIRSLLRKVYQNADQVIVLGSCMKQRLQDSPWNVPSDRIGVIPNWADCESITPVDPANNDFRETHGLTDRFVVMHSGNMGLTQRLDVMVDATAHPAWPENATLLLVGGGASKDRLQQQVADLGPEATARVRFMDYQPREQLGQSLSAADLHVVSMHEKITGCLCPSKLYGILAAGRPLLAIASDGTDLCQTVQHHHLGWTCAPGNVECVANLVAEAAVDHEKRLAVGRTCRVIAESKYDRSVTTEQFQLALSSLVETSESATEDIELGLEIPASSSEDSNLEVAPL